MNDRATGTAGTGLLPLAANDPAQVAGYTLHARLGSGGMGTVYLSFSRGGRPVAVKLVRQEFADDPEFRRRFAREISAARRVQGHYTAPVLDADPGAQLVVMLAVEQLNAASGTVTLLATVWPQQS